MISMIFFFTFYFFPFGNFFDNLSGISFRPVRQNIALQNLIKDFEKEKMYSGWPEGVMEMI